MGQRWRCCIWTWIGFKHVNDNLGHPAGDRLLREMACPLIRLLLRDDDLVCRLGGDEFAVILHEIRHEEDAALVAQKLLESSADNRYMLEGAEVVVTPVSVSPCFPRMVSTARRSKKMPILRCITPKAKAKIPTGSFDDELNSSGPVTGSPWNTGCATPLNATN